MEWPQGLTPVFFEHKRVVSLKLHWRISWGIRHQVLVFQLLEHVSVLAKIFFRHAPVCSGEVIEGAVAVPIASRSIIGVVRHNEYVEMASGI